MNKAYLTEEALARGVRHLCKSDPDLASIARDFGPPPMWAREEGFHTLIHIILEQQVSLASARAAYERLLQTVSPLTPATFLELDDASLKRIGFSRQKTAYGRNLAQAVVDNSLNIAALGSMHDRDVKQELMKIKGIGHWTSDIYLLMALRRPDIWPNGDLALAVAVEKVKRLTARPTYEELASMSLLWRPWRAVAARMLWHFYLSNRK
jgi:DNA-3-methyladenine glycosylase II